MLDLEKNRVDYGDMLSAPEGYETDFAVGTTYSLDFPLLASACMSLGLSVSMDSGIKDSPLFLFHAMEKVKDKVLMFCQKGQIHNTDSQRELWILLENVIHQVDPATKGLKSLAVFHPKFWLIRYREISGKALKYRLIVTSRNCADSRDLDITAVLESKKGNGEQKNAGIQDFLEYLMKQPSLKPRNAKKIAGLAEQLSSIIFDLDGSEFDDYEFMSTGIGGLDINEQPPFKEGQVKGETEVFDRVLIISPFLSQPYVGEPKQDDEPIRRFNRAAARKGTREENSKRCILLTRAEELHKLKPEHCDNFEVWIAQQGFTEGEAEEDQSISGATLSNGAGSTSEYLAEPEEQELTTNSGSIDIHAKVFLREKAGMRDLFFGSLNASKKALTQNVEVLLRLRMKGYQRTSYYDRVLDELFGKGSPFEKVDINNYQKETEESPAERLRNTLAQVVRAIKSIKARVQEAEGGYRMTFVLTLKAPVATNLAECSYKAQLSPLLLSHGKAVRLDLGEKSQTVSFEPLEASCLSSFVRLSLRDPNSDTEVFSILKVDDDIVGMPERDGALLSNLIRDNAEELLALTEFILSDSPEMTLMETRITTNSVFCSKAFLNYGNALYENMLKTAWASPKRLKDMKKTFAYLSENERDALPKGLIALVEAFEKAVK